MEYSKVMESAAPDVCLMMVQSIFACEFFSMLGKGPFLGYLFCTWYHVVKPSKKTTRLSCDDRDRESSSKVMEDEALL